MLMGLFGTDRSRELWWHRFIKGTLYTFEHTRRLRIKAVSSATAFTGQRLQGGHCFRRIPFIKIIEIKFKTKNLSNSRRYSSFNNLIEAFYEFLYQSKLDLNQRCYNIVFREGREFKACFLKFYSLSLINKNFPGKGVRIPRSIDTPFPS